MPELASFSSTPDRPEYMSPCPAMDSTVISIVTLILTLLTGVCVAGWSAWYFPHSADRARAIEAEVAFMRVRDKLYPGAYMFKSALDSAIIFVSKRGILGNIDREVQAEIYPALLNDLRFGLCSYEAGLFLLLKAVSDWTISSPQQDDVYIQVTELTSLLSAPGDLHRRVQHGIGRRMLKKGYNGQMRTLLRWEFFDSHDDRHSACPKAFSQIDGTLFKMRAAIRSEQQDRPRSARPFELLGRQR